MAEGRRYGLAPQLDIDQILMEAQHRWLRPAEICEILKNYKKFRIAPEPPNRPQSGSLFLFDRKVLRYFRKDGHNWRKKKDGKTIKEAHERLKAGSVDVLHCYYAHGEDNECFQRRSYWMLEEHLMHIVLVHYLEVKGGRSNLHRIREVEHSNNADSPLCSTSFTSQSQNNLPSQNTEAESSISGQTSEYEDAESVLQFNASVSKAKFDSADNLSSGGTGYHSFPQMQQEYNNGPGSIINPSLFNPFANSTTDNLHLGGEFRDMAAPVPFSELYTSQEDLAKAFGEPDVDTSFNGQAAHFDLSAWDDVVYPSTVTTAMQTPSSIDMSFTSTQQIPFGEDDIKFDNLIFDGAYASEFDLKEGDIPSVDLKSQWEILPDNYELQERPIDGKADSPLFPPLEKGDSFNRWMSNELEEVDSNVKSNSHTLWNTVEAEAVLAHTGGSSHGHLDTYMVGPMISQDQLFSIVDYSPSWAYASITTKVLVMGTFLKSNEEVNRCKWSCMFGEIEVPADILSDGTLRCYAPTHKPGRVPFYVTCSNRLACSEVREFEFRAIDSQSMDISDPNNRITDEMYLSMRLEKLITLGPNAQQISIVSSTEEKQKLSNKITSLMSESDEWSNLLKFTDEGGLGFLDENPKDELVEGLMKEKLHLWLLTKVNEEGKGPCVLDKEGQGVIHLTAALGYDWAIRPTITAGVNINFRDAHGWTALHWAAFCGREKTVVALIALGAAPGLLTDPTPEFPSGRTPADLASSNNHKGISGFLAESSLTSLLEILILKDSKCADLALMHTVQTGATDVNIPTDDGSLKDSLSAVRNAAITRARIYQVFRMQSFQRKQPKEFDDDVLGISGEWAMAMAPAKLVKASPGNKVHLAATRIQNKFCGHKRRKEFLLIKQHIVKIQGYLFITPQAHMRGHQVRKHYRKIVRSVGIVEKIILRWRCRGSGLRGFQFDGPSLEGPSNVQIKPAKDDDDLDETIESFQRSPPVGDSPVYGRENEKNSIIGFLLSDDFNRSNLTVVCIVGESGIGKTSLAHLIYSEERILDSFDARVFITMPEKSDETRLIKKLIESITSSPCPMTEADLLEELLIDELSGTKVFVVLDDADNENPCFWNRIVTILNHSTRGSILLVTTKSEDVAEVIGAMRTHFLDPLSDNYCWKLFWQHIFTGLNTNANTDLVEIGKQLVSKCQHNLLCIKVLAGLLVCLKNVESWVEILKTDLWNMDGFDGDTLPILRMCYETLPDNLKKCLHYCSLFPKDYVFAKQQIVRMWMSQGFIVSVEGRQPEEAGLQNFDELLLRGFFQHSPLHDVEEDKYIMHDLIRALATHFSRTECASAEDAVERTLVNCFHFSLNPSVIQIDKMKPLIKEASDLQSFLVLSRLQTRINISIQDITSLSDLFTKCINLRTLDLSCTDIVELPSSVGMLKQLRYLGVNNTKIRSIPRELCSLVSLETLEAKDCQHLVELPENMMELTSLRHLDVSKKSGCVKMMIGIGLLTNLQSLAVFCVGCEMPYCSIRELKDLNSLSSCLQIAGLENIRNGLEAKEAALHNKVHLNTLWLHWNDNRTCIESEESVTISEEVLKNLKPNPNIGELIIRNYRGNLFPTWMGDPSFSKLVSIILDKCLNCSQFPALGGLPSLRHLSVQKLYHLVRLENKDSQFVSKNTPKFPSLETLNLWEMYDLEELFETSDCDFPCLRTVSLSRCPMLKSVPCFSSLQNLSLYCCVKLPYLPDFPSLKSFRIDGFKKIKSIELPKDLPALKELEIRHCNELLVVEGLPKLRSLEKLNVVHCPKFDPFKSWKPSHSKSISTTRWFFPKEESTTQVEHEETLNLADVLRSPGLPLPPCSLADQWEKGRLIGSGTFGNVFEATNRHTGALCAMKEVNIIAKDAKSIESLKQLEQEIWFLSQYQHPNIVQYYGCEITEDRFYIYLEYVHPGSINKYVRQHYGAMTESVVRNFTLHILSGLAYLHSKKIMHRDIKGANLLVDAKGVVKLADFGLAKSLSEAAPNLPRKGVYWMAPEVLQATIVKDSGGYDLAVDIWSLGCTLIEMFTGKPPWSGFEGPAAMFKVLHKTPPIPDSLSSEGRDFLQKCFRRNPAERPTATVLLEHPFIRNASYYNYAHGAMKKSGTTPDSSLMLGTEISSSEVEEVSKEDTNSSLSHSC